MKIMIDKEIEESKYGDIPSSELSDSLYKLKSKVIETDPRIGVGHRIVQVIENGEVIERAKFTPYKEYLTMALKFANFKRNSVEHRWLITRLSNIRFNIWRMEEENIDLMSIVDEDIDDLHAILMGSLSLDKSGLEILTEKISRIDETRQIATNIKKASDVLYSDTNK